MPALTLALSRLAVFVVFVALWHLGATRAGDNLIATPLETAQAGLVMIADGALWTAIGQSLAVYLSGYGLAAFVAIPVGLLMGGLKPLGLALDPYVNALTATPRVAFIPLIIVLFGLGVDAKIAIIFLGAVMPILINTYAGVLNSDAELVEMARAAGASRAQVFLKIMLPGALPFVVAGLRLGAAIGLINTVVAELYTSISGLGGLLSRYGNSFQMARYFVVVFLLALIGLAVTQGLRAVETRLMRWRTDAA